MYTHVGTLYTISFPPSLASPLRPLHREIKPTPPRTRQHKTSRKREPQPRGEDGRFKTKTKATTATTLLSTPQSNPWPTPAQSALLSSPIRAPGAYPFTEPGTSPSPLRTVPFPSDSPFELLHDLPPEPSPTRSRRSVTPSTPPYLSSRLDSSPEAVEQALDDELQFDDEEPAFEHQPKPSAEDHEDLTVTVPSNLNPSTATAQPVVVPPQVPSQMANPDMKLVHQRLGDLRRFNDNGDPMTEAEYREQFIDITDGVADDVRAKLWASNLAYQGAAWWWHRLNSEDPNTSAAMKTWSTLVLEIEKRWPTPVLNKSAYRRATQEAFWNHKLNVAEIADSLINNDTVSLPHQVWASEHYAKGMACNSTDVDRVSYTLRHCVDFTVIQLLPKRHDYDDDFKGLCKDIGEINPLSLYFTWKNQDDVDKLLAGSFTSLYVPDIHLFHHHCRDRGVSTVVMRAGCPRGCLAQFFSSPYLIPPISLSSLSRVLLPTTSKQSDFAPPRDARGCFLPRSASNSSSATASAFPGAFPTPVSLAGPKVSTPPVPSPDSSSPSLESLILALDGTATPVTADPNPLLGVPFPSPIPNPLPHSFATPPTPTPTARTRRTAALSDPPRPSPGFVAQLAKTVLPPLPTVTVTAPPMTQPTAQAATTTATSSKDLRAARANLNSLPQFDDDLSPMREVEWRHKFIIATRGVTNEERAQLYEDSLVFEGVAYDWYQALQNAGATELAESKDWSTLLPHIEARWPTPVRDPLALAEQKRLRWDNSIFRVEDMLTELRDETNPIKPHETWAKQHLSRGRDRGSKDGDLVHDTVKKALPVWLVALLPKCARYGTDFAGLCKDIGELSSAEIIHAFGVNQAVESMQGLSFNQPTTQPPPRAPTPTATTRTSSFRRTQSYAASPTVPAQQTPIPAPSFTATQTTTRASQVAFATPLVSANPSPNPFARQPPPHMPATPAPTPQPPRTPARPLRDPAPALVAEDTADERARHSSLVSEFVAKYGVGATPNLEKPYPLSPGTFQQTRNVCIKCGRAFHTAVQCKDRSLWLEEEERLMRGAIVRSITGIPSRAGSIPGTPTPGPRPVRDTAQLEEAEEIALAEAYVPENEEGHEPGLGRLSFSRSETVYLSDDVCFVPALNDIVDSYVAAPEVVDLYEIFEKNKYKENPFRIRAQIAHGSNAENGLDARATVDGGAMLCVMDRTYWSMVEGELGELAKSPIICRMANGSCTPSIGRGNAFVCVGGQWHHIEFEVLDSQGNYDILLGKPWLRAAGAAQVFVKDTLIISGPDGPIELQNEHPRSARLRVEDPAEPIPPPVTDQDDGPPPREEPKSGTNAPKPSESIPVRQSRRLRGEEVELADESDNPFWLDSDLLEKLERWTGMEKECELEDARGVDPEPESAEGGRVTDQSAEESEDEFLDRMWHLAMQEREEMAQREILLMDLCEQGTKTDLIGKLLDRAVRAIQRAKGPADIQAMEEQEREDRHQSAQRRVTVPPIPFSDRVQDPFRADRVTDILNKVKIGDDLELEQRKRVSDLVREYADVFALSLSEVLPVDFSEMRLDIPEGTSFPRRAGQKRLTEPQRQWLYKTLDDMENAKIIAKVTQDQVAAVSPTNIVPKPGGAELPSLASLRKMANEQCKLYGLPILWPDVEVEGPENTKPSTETKYRLVHNFVSVNKVTQLRPFPMGDLPSMQRKVSSHRWISVMDFLAGFNAIPMAPESIPYTGFHVDGRGYYVYLRMPFGLTGAPTTFCEMISAAFHDLIGSMLEVWMDDVATASDEFEEGLGNLRTIFAKCRAHGLSLSPAKTVLFMSEARFAGAQCSSEGVKPDLSKVRAILEWPEPKSALEIMSFLGCVGSFRSCIRNYARIAQPLSDLTRDIRPPQIGTPAGRHDYQKALRDARVELSEDERKAFAELKVILTSDVVMRAPVYDGRPFTVTTDGSKFGFGAMLSQEWEVTDTKGVTRKVMYPVAFASKRTSRTEERYIPFLLEFAALKFGLDEFDNIIFGQPIIIETDCKALADLLGNNKLNSTHERWRESIVARNIVGVKHRPGVENRVCDALSRMYEARPDDNTGPGANDSVDPGWEAAKGIINDVCHLVDDSSTASLIQRFSDDPFFTDILMYLLFDTGSNNTISADEERARKRRAHRAQGYMVDDGKLWLVEGKPTKLGTRVECIPSSEAKSLALAVHSAGGHFGRDMTILALQQRYFWPELRRDVIEAVTSCPRCKNFGPRLLSAQMQPITRARPFDLIVGDYASLPVGHGGFKTVLLLVDVYSRFLFAFPLKGPGTGKFTVQALD
ncbi:Retrovirus-related Pol polyprotein from transposon [Ceratobasidium sp. AG-Ba]|nr:Retrovirus-related Pol polyprotein from transposon [Ceratobasidium sp. AG-Ba]